VGKFILLKNKDSCIFSVQSTKDILAKIVPHFDKYQLITQKRADYLLWKQAVIMVSRKQHLTPQGLQEIVNLRANCNLSEVLQNAFPNTIPVERPVIENIIVPNPN
jgi:LAGLIDADG endonuclease